ncbi:hypothetical protein E8E14_008700 [Neopestalotiopsis sp. 37M]|nr:hypothetical protein E8E14_008700 [Neopestalotiopsis sp. 37M]
MHFIARHDSGRHYAVDDYLMFVVLALYLPFTVVGQYARLTAFGVDIWTESTSTVTTALKLFFIDESFYLALLALCKLVMLCFFLRIFPNRWFRITVYVAIGFVASAGVVLVFLQIFQCVPLDFNWEGWKGTFGTHKCLNVNALTYTAASISIFQDVCLLLLPLPLTLTLHTSRRNKLNIVVMFSLGFFILLTSCIRLRYIVLFARTVNPTWDYTDTLIWTALEVNVSIVVISLPAIRVYLSKYLPKVFGSTVGSGAASHPRSHGGSSSTAKRRLHNSSRQISSNKFSSVFTTTTKRRGTGDGDSDTESQLELGDRGHGMTDTEIAADHGSHHAEDSDGSHGGINVCRTTIRLLILLPSPNAAEIHARLATISLNDGHKFDALSYVWGEDDDSEPIIVDGQTIKVRKNLKSALRRLGSFASQAEGLWIDAICINQDDSQEKTFQLPLMRAIYTQASTVIVWLGEGNEYIGAIFQRAQFAESAESIGNAYPPMDILNKDKRGEKAFIGWIDFFLLPYWQRMWTYQELALPKSDPICVYGSHRSSLSMFITDEGVRKFNFALDLNILEAEAASLDTSKYDVPGPGDIQNALNGEKFSNIRRGILTARTRNRSGVYSSLTSSIKATLGRQCYDPRDRIYALYGIHEAVGRAFPADYGKNNSAEKVLIEASVWSVEMEQDGPRLFRSFGMRASRFCDNLSLSSWIPDFDSPCSIENVIIPTTKTLLERSASDSRPATHVRDAVVLVGRPGVGIVATGEPIHKAIPASISQFLEAMFPAAKEASRLHVESIVPHFSKECDVIPLPAFQEFKESALIEEGWYDEVSSGDAQKAKRAHHGPSIFGDLPSLRMTARNLGHCNPMFEFESDQNTNMLYIMAILMSERGMDSWNLTLQTMDRMLPRRSYPSALTRENLQTSAAFTIATGYAEILDFWKDLFGHTRDISDAQTQEENLKAELAIFIVTRANCIGGISTFSVYFMGQRCLGFAAHPVKKGDIAIIPLDPYQYTFIIRREQSVSPASGEDSQEKPPHGTWDDLVYHRMVGVAFMQDLAEETNLTVELAEQGVEDFYIR